MRVRGFGGSGFGVGGFGFDVSRCRIRGYAVPGSGFRGFLGFGGSGFRVRGFGYGFSRIGILEVRGFGYGVRSSWFRGSGL